MRNEDSTQGNKTMSSVGPSKNEMKSHFKARSIPLEVDFENLIDIADCGRKAVGLSPDYTPVLDTGLILDGISGQLKVQPSAAKGIAVDSSGIGVKVDATKGITVGANGVGVNMGNGIASANNQLHIKLAKGNGLSNGGGGQGVNGATSGSNGGLNLTADGLSVDVGAGLQLNAEGVTVKCATNGGLTVSEFNGLAVSDVIVNGTPWTAIVLSYLLGGSIHYRRHGGMVMVKYSVTRLGSDVADNSIIGTLPLTHAPAQTIVGFGTNRSGQGTNCIGAGYHTFTIDKSGLIRVIQGGKTLEVSGAICFPAA